MKRPQDRKRVRIGDVLESRVEGEGVEGSGGVGYVYFQISLKHETHGFLVRALPGVHGERVRDLGGLVGGESLWCAFSPVNLMIGEDLLRIVDHQPVPERERSLPVFKACNHLLDGRKDWFLWDGQTDTHIGTTLPKKYHDYPVDQIVDLKILEDRVVTGWHPRDEVAPGPARGLRG